MPKIGSICVQFGTTPGEYKLLNSKDIDITSATDLGDNLANADLFIVDDAAAGTQASTKKISASNMKNYFQGSQATTIADDAIWAAAGDLVHATGNDAASVLSIGTANQILHVNAGATAPEWSSNLRIPNLLSNTITIGKNSDAYTPNIITTKTGQSSGLTLSVQGATNVGNTDNAGGFGFIHLQEDQEGDMFLKPGAGPAGALTPGTLHIGREHGEVKLHAGVIVDLLGNILLTNGSGGNFGMGGGSGGNVLNMQTISNAVNNIQLRNAITTEVPLLEVIGDDTNIDLAIQPKGTGALQVKSDKSDPLTDNTCNTTSGSTTITHGNLSGIDVYGFAGMTVSGNGIPSGTLITQKNLLTNDFVISQAATITATGVTLSFDEPIGNYVSMKGGAWRDEVRIEAEGKRDDLIGGIDLVLASKKFGHMQFHANGYRFKTNEDTNHFGFYVDPDTKSLILGDNISDEFISQLTSPSDGIMFAVGKEAITNDAKLWLYDIDNSDSYLSMKNAGGGTYFYNKGSGNIVFNSESGGTNIGYQFMTDNDQSFMICHQNFATRFKIDVDAEAATIISTDDSNVDEADHLAHLTFDIDGNIRFDAATGSVTIQKEGGVYLPTSDSDIATKKYVDDEIPDLQDDDVFSSANAITTASSESIKAYVDNRKEYVYLSDVIYIDGGTAGRTYFRDADDSYGDRLHEFDASDTENSTTIGNTITSSWTSNTGGLIVPFGSELVQVQWQVYSVQNYDNEVNFQTWTSVGPPDASIGGLETTLTLRQTENKHDYKRSHAKILTTGALATLSQGDIIYPAINIVQFTTGIKWAGRVSYLLKLV